MFKKSNLNINLIIGVVIVVAGVILLIDNKVFASPKVDQPMAYTVPALGDLSVGNNLLTSFADFQKKFSKAPAEKAAPLDQETILYADNPSSFVQAGGVKTRCKSITSHLRYIGDETEKALWDTLTPEMKQWYADQCAN